MAGVQEQPGFFHYSAKPVRACEDRRAHRDIIGYMRQNRERNLRTRTQVRDPLSYMLRQHELEEAQREILYHRFYDQKSGLTSDEFWSANDRANRRKNGTYKRHAGHMPRLGSFVTASFPHLVNLTDAIEVIDRYAEHLGSTYKVACEAVIHARNSVPDHAHFFVSDRMVDENGVGKKNRSLNGMAAKITGNSIRVADSYIISAPMEDMRATWAQLIRNIAPLGTVIDHRSFERRGLTTSPVTYVPRSTIREQEARGDDTWRQDRKRELAQRAALVEQGPSEPAGQRGSGLAPTACNLDWTTRSSRRSPQRHGGEVAAMAYAASRNRKRLDVIMSVSSVDLIQLSFVSVSDTGAIKPDAHLEVVRTRPVDGDVVAPAMILAANMHRSSAVNEDERVEPDANKPEQVTLERNSDFFTPWSAHRMSWSPRKADTGSGKNAAIAMLAFVGRMKADAARHPRSGAAEPPRRVLAALALVLSGLRRSSAATLIAIASRHLQTPKEITPPKVWRVNFFDGSLDGRSRRVQTRHRWIVDLALRALSSKQAAEREASSTARHKPYVASPAIVEAQPEPRSSQSSKIPAFRTLEEGHIGLGSIQPDTQIDKTSPIISSGDRASLQAAADLHLSKRKTISVPGSHQGIDDRWKNSRDAHNERPGSATPTGKPESEAPMSALPAVLEPTVTRVAVVRDLAGADHPLARATGASVPKSSNIVGAPSNGSPEKGTSKHRRSAADIAMEQSRHIETRMLDEGDEEGSIDHRYRPPTLPRRDEKPSMNAEGPRVHRGETSQASSTAVGGLLDEGSLRGTIDGRHLQCVSACNNDPLIGVIGVQN